MLCYEPTGCRARPRQHVAFSGFNASLAAAAIRAGSFGREVSMALSVHDYLIEQSGIDWPEVLAGWEWLLPSGYALWLVNRFADLFLVLSDGTVHMLDVGAGTLARVADSRDDFCSRIDEGNNANEWLVIPLVDQLVAADMRLQPGQCYGFKTPPILGGEYVVENLAVLPVRDYLGASGTLHEQLRDVLDGSQVVLKVRNKPARPGSGAGRHVE
jgi:hypothetical protein